jgi:multiple sugar transport system permease protein
MSSNRWLPYALITPAVLFLGLFFIAPLVQTITLSFNGGGTPDVLANYKRMANDLNFGVSIRNTFLLVLAVIPIQLALALAMGMMLQKMERGRDIVLWIWTIPLGVSDLAAGLAWLSIMQNTGYLNTVLFSLGLVDGPTAWLNSESPATLFIAVVLTEVWRSTAVVLVVLVAGLQLIPKEFGEAAEIFGASPWTKFRKVTLPLLKPSIQSALILRTVLAFEVFAAVYALGGRNFPVLVGEAYVWQNENQNYGVAAAYAVLVMTISLAATLVYLFALRTKPEAQS